MGEGAAAVLNRRLERNIAAPLIVAFSGGGDSLSLLLTAKAWADAAGRRLMAVTIDHRIQPAGAGWARWCEARARRLGIEHRTLAWEGPKPAAGLAAAARGQRHRLIARAAREAGAAVILMGHTADDLAEASFMRGAGVRVSDPDEWSPSPVWPEGRDLFILRPLLAAPRAELRAALAAAGETWIEDPANTDAASPRARARAVLEAAGTWPCAASVTARRHRAAPPPLREGGLKIEHSLSSILPRHLAGEGYPEGVEGARGHDPDDRGFGAAGLDGGLTLRRHVLATTRARAFLAAAVLCASGAERPPRGPRLDRLADRIAAGERFVATLAGARIEADGPEVRVLREAGDLRRAGGADLALHPGETAVWDGRFEIRAHRAGLAVGPLEGHARALSRAERAGLKTLAPAARRALPAIVDRRGRVSCPTLVPDPRLAIRPLVMPRLAGASGAIRCEAEIGAWRKRPGHPRLGLCARDEADR